MPRIYIKDLPLKQILTSDLLIPVQSTSDDLITPNEDGNVLSQDIVNRANHVGKYLISSVIGLQNILDYYHSLIGLPPLEANKFLTNNGKVPVWAETTKQVPSFSSQTGKYLKVNNTVLTWSEVGNTLIDAIDIDAAGKIFSTDGDTPVWIETPEYIPSINGNTSNILASNGANSEWSDTISIIGNNTVVAGSTNTYTIPNYNSFKTYTVVKIGTAGSVSIVGDTITYTAPNSNGLYGFKINNRNIRILVGSSITNTPSIVFPIAGNTINSLMPTFESSTFSVSAGEGSHVASQWQVATDSNFSNIIVNSNIDYTNLTTYKVTSALNNNTAYYVRVRYYDQYIGWSAWSIGNSFSVNYATIKTPTINSISPNYGSDGLFSVYANILEHEVVTLSVSTFDSIGISDTFEKTDTQYSLYQTFNTILQSVSTTDSSSSIVIPNYVFNNNLINSTIYVRVRHKGQNLGYSNWSEVKAIQIPNFYAAKPSITYPINASTNMPNNITATLGTYAATNGYGHKSSQWQASASSTFAIIVEDSGETLTSKSSYQFENLSYGVRYYLRVRTKDLFADVWSSWSDSVYFTTQNIANVPSVIYPSNNLTNVSVSFTATSTAFVPVLGSTHVSSQWQVSTSNTFANIVTDSGETTTYKTNFNILNLNTNTSYYVRVRYKDSLSGWSGWSSSNLFTTNLSYIITPEITTPTTNIQLISNSIICASTELALSSGIGTHISSQWQISNDINFNTVIIDSGEDLVNLTSKIMLTNYYPTLIPNTGYYVRVRYREQNIGWSQYSVPIRFVTAESKVLKPSISSISNSYTISSYSNSIFLNDIKNGNSQFTITNMAFNPPNYVDNFGNMQIQLSTDSGFGNSFIVYDHVYNNFNNNITIPSYVYNTGLLNNQLYARIRYKSTSLSYSEWSDIFTMYIINYTIDKPAMVYPQHNSTGVPLTFIPSVSYNAYNLTSNLYKCQWQISTSSTFSSIYIDSGEVDPTWNVSDAAYLLSNNQTYYIRGRIKTNIPAIALNSPWSEWSNGAMFKTLIG